MKRIFGSLGDLLNRKNAGFVSGFVFFIFALMIVIFWFWKTLFIVLFTIGGYIFGVKVLMNPENLRRIVDKILPPGRFR